MGAKDVKRRNIERNTPCFDSSRFCDVKTVEKARKYPVTFEILETFVMEKRKLH